MHLELLKSLNFTEIGTINTVDGKVVFDITDPDYDVKQDNPSVYAWVETDTVKYIGKAGKGIRKRLKEHTQGWNGGSVTGIRKANYISESVLRTGKPIRLFGRRCDVVRCFGIAVSNISTEESALIKLLDPDWNVEGK